MSEPWNSLELAKVLIAIINPIILLGIGWFVNKRLKEIDQSQWRNQKIIEKRIEIYSELAPLFNDLFCYFTYVGNWKEFSPKEIIAHKRTIDRGVYLAAPLFSSVFFERAMEFIDLCFDTYTEKGGDAKLKTGSAARIESYQGDWDTAWEVCFCEKEKRTPRKDIKIAYDWLMRSFADDIGLSEDKNFNTHRTKK